MKTAEEWCSQLERSLLATTEGLVEPNGLNQFRSQCYHGQVFDRAVIHEIRKEAWQELCSDIFQSLPSPTVFKTEDEVLRAHRDPDHPHFLANKIRERLRVRMLEKPEVYEGVALG